MKLWRSSQTALVLAELLRDQSGWRYGYDISRNTGLKSGTLYLALMRLAKERLVLTSWEKAPEPGRPPRHLYKLTDAGLRYAQENAAAPNSAEPACQTWNEVTA